MRPCPRLLSVILSIALFASGFQTPITFISTKESSIIGARSWSLPTRLHVLANSTVTTTTSYDFEGFDYVVGSPPSDELRSASITSYDSPSHLMESNDQPPSSRFGVLDSLMGSYIGPRLVLASVSILYGTNFALGAIMNDSLPASAATSNRMVLASITLLPFLLQLKPNLRTQVLIGGLFVSLGYISQSIALIDECPAVVSFLGSCTVIVCPLLQWIVDKKPIQAQTWAAVFLCLAGVFVLELMGTATDLSLADSFSQVGMGDVLSLVQALAFGTGIYMSERMMKQEPDQALPITAAMVSVTAFCAMLWSFTDGWMSEPGWESFGLPGLFLEPSMRDVSFAVLWTGVLSTSVNFCIEMSALGRVPSSEAAVLLATEPLWASVFAATFYHESFGLNDVIGGTLMISACLVNSIKFSGGLSESEQKE